MNQSTSVTLKGSKQINIVIKMRGDGKIVRRKGMRPPNTFFSFVFLKAKNILYHTNSCKITLFFKKKKTWKCEIYWSFMALTLEFKKKRCQTRSKADGAAVLETSRMEWALVGAQPQHARGPSARARELGVWVHSKVPGRQQRQALEHYGSLR